MQQSAARDTFGSRLKWLREKQGLTLEDFGQRIGFGRSYLSKLENGKSLKTSEEFIYRVCHEFVLNRDWLLSGNGGPFEYDYLNQGIAQGKVPVFKARHSQVNLGVSFASLYAAGITLTFHSDTKSLAGTIASIHEKHQFTDQMRSEITRILSEELSARMATNNPAGEFRQPISDLGKFAVAAVAVSKQQHEREKTAVIIPSGGHVKKTVQETGIAKSALTNEANALTNESVQPVLPKLIQRLKRATTERGKKVELAEWLGVHRQMVTDWLSGKQEPGGEITLRLLHWVERQESQK